MMKKLVFFDLDGTILNGISSENAFFLHLLLHGYIGIKQLIYSVIFLFKWFPKYKFHVFIKNKAYLTGLPVDQINQLGKNFVIQKLLHKIRPELKNRILTHQNIGDITILLTGSHDFLAKVFTKFLRLDRTEATICIDQNNLFTHLPPKQHPFSSEKLHIAQKLCDLYNVSMKDCIAYGNSINDSILLNQVGHPVAVTPDRRLYKIAKKRGWEIIPSSQI